jgi:anhydro-N-acetylmuramic acid kinase
MLKPGRQRVLGAEVTRAGLRVALIETDGHALTGLGPCVSRGLPGGGEAAELALAEVCAGFDGVALMGLGESDLLPPDAAMTLAQALGWPVVSDFASADQRLGGFGAPLAAFFHHALVRSLGLGGPVAVLDLGDVASLTWCDPRSPSPEEGCVAFHAGPGLAALTPGALGQVDAARLSAYAQHAWFRRIPPKVLAGAGPLPDLHGLGPEDARATLAAAVAASVALGFEHFPEAPARLLVAGEGARHGALMAMLAAGCDCPVEPLPEPEAVSARALAWLAVRVAMGLPTTGPRTTGVAAPVGGGTLHRP